MSDPSALDRAKGHMWTLVPTLRTALQAPVVPPFVKWRTQIEDPVVGTVGLSGALHEADGADTLLIAIHGLGGSIDSPYMARPAAAAAERGISCLRLNLRGADLSGDDVYHGGLTLDLDAALKSEALSRYQHIYLLGFSMGGHMALRWALQPTDPRVRAVTTVCSPLDLAASCKVIDQPARWFYRRHVVRGLRNIHAAGEWAGKRSWGDVRGIKRIAEWDTRVIAPRFGFESAEQYWEQMSVGPQLGRLALPCLLLSTELDPMVTPDTLWPSLRSLQAPSEGRWLVGGHIGFPSWADIPGDAIDWLLTHR